MSADDKKGGDPVEMERLVEEPPSPTLPTVNPETEAPKPAGLVLPPWIYVVAWISFSSLVILFNKWVLHTLNFKYPVILTTYHLVFATVVTQIMARYTTMLDSRKAVKMTGRIYLRAVVPIGVFFSASLILSNVAYLYLSVSFIQMLKATTPMAVLLAGWALGVSQPTLKQAANVSVIVLGVIIASVGEIDFVLAGFVIQLGGVMFEALRLTMVQRLLSGDLKMDPLVSLYYFAPVCAALNAVIAIFTEVPRCTMAEVLHVGLFTFFLNGLCAFMLNVSLVLLIGKTSAVVLTICGVLKDILLVIASMVIFGSRVTALQFFGYSIALGGMVYYKLGYEQLKGHIADFNRQWAAFGAEKPVLRRISIVVLAVFVALALLGGVQGTM
ncbi:hypothetical protein V2A60_009053 [Cordyceps javanica]|uniref:DUF250 domain membrane protein n=1 Tax=Cordyceps javanica TaxID=43265 RepID=A0A545UT01_9HYPO|nr:DUF250 domain membrane protein [Cordyceps javanica]TQW03454.1 DUF250 domain membrane protein [Cordyceps javanica]